MSDPAGTALNTDLILSFTRAEAWVVGGGVLCLALTAFLRRPTWARWALLAFGMAQIGGALR